MTEMIMPNDTNPMGGNPVRRRELRLVLGGRMKPEEAIHIRSIFT